MEKFDKQGLGFIMKVQRITVIYIVQYLEKHMLLNYRGLFTAKDLKRGLKLIIINGN